jgi:hypothetical protein
MPSPSRTIQTAEPPLPADVERLRQGELSEREYFERRVAVATRHLGGWLLPEQLAFIEATVTELFDCDPVLQHLVSRASTGGTGTPELGTRVPFDGERPTGARRCPRGK